MSRYFIQYSHCRWVDHLVLNPAIIRIMIHKWIIPRDQMIFELLEHFIKTFSSEAFFLISNSGPYDIHHWFSPYDLTQIVSCEWIADQQTTTSCCQQLFVNYKMKKIARQHIEMNRWKISYYITILQLNFCYRRWNGNR